MSPLNRDADHLARLREYHARHRGFPSYARMGEVLGMVSKAAVKKLLERLEEQGFLQRSADGVWTPGERFFQRSLAASPVRAGLPTAEEAANAEPFLIDAFLVEHPNRTVLVPVTGDSMIEAGIHDGDVVVVDCGLEARAGDLVVAVVDSAFTLKELARDAEGFVLKPHNAAYPLIRPRERLEIFGVVTGLARKYRR
ncbi:MAG: LexA family transcriptional regulator [Magnetococcales bacterium]|nr:LexA family transcriptional regulator [Magnetococcales bacterium]